MASYYTSCFGERAAVRAFRLSRDLRTKMTVDVLLVLQSSVTAAVAGTRCVICDPAVTCVRGARASLLRFSFFSCWTQYRCWCGLFASRATSETVCRRKYFFFFFDVGTCVDMRCARCVAKEMHCLGASVKPDDTVVPVCLSCGFCFLRLSDDHCAATRW